MRVYEEYNNRAEKRSAQHGAKRGAPTGKARGYAFIFNENGRNNLGHYDGTGPLMSNTDPGSSVDRCPMASGGFSFDYLRENCRRVSRSKLPPDWKAMAEQYLAS